ncbi:MAG: hypothetical protein JRN67_05915, partial [Nitrososphaerota archaeon]|nr:hypothetical protein [Nitrososphaerota archaeon]
PDLVFASLNALNVWIFGSSEYKRYDIHLKLQENDCTYWIAYSEDELVYVGSYLHDISELGSYASFVRSNALIPEPVCWDSSFPTQTCFIRATPPT